MFRFDPAFFAKTFWDLVGFIPVVLYVLLLSILFGVLLGLLLACAKLGKIKILGTLAYGYTTLIRCTPSIVLLFLVYYGLPILLSKMGIRIDETNRLVFLVITFMLFCGASLSELMRSAYLSIDRGQLDAALSVGMTPFRAFIRILASQIFFVMIPPFGNIVIGVLKEGSLAFTIGFIDVIGRANLINDQTAGNYALEIFICAALLYWVMSFGMERIFGFLEKSLGKHRLEF